MNKLQIIGGGLAGSERGSQEDDKQSEREIVLHQEPSQRFEEVGPLS